MSPFLNFLKYLIPFAIVLFLVQHFTVANLFKNIPFFYSTWSIYVFHIIITLLSYLFLLFVHKNFPDKTGFTFMGIGLIKMMAGVVFLIPMIQSDTIDRIPDVAAFFIPYFLFLFFETIFAVRLINKV
ncbi:hypothetical protein [uncultured Flavobacterium sp.]|uniref:hypothetical protein n=1 Tax=uncultured Flavobacterium sp. TaxID=165435 RepID=UPI0025E0BFDA|nr:hypothetical protein [uncultured Flavobacterium sp.]